MKKQIITATTAVVLGSTLFAGAASAQSIKVKKATRYGIFQENTTQRSVKLNQRTTFVQTLFMWDKLYRLTANLRVQKAAVLLPLLLHTK